MAKNNESVESQISVNILADGSSAGSGTISNWGNMSNLKSIGKLAKGDYTYSLTYAGEEICRSTFEVRDAADEVAASCGSISAYPNEYVKNLVSLSNTGNLSNAQGKILIGSDTKASNGGCGNSGCGEMGFNVPSTEGTYDYSFTLNGTEKCTGTITVNSLLTCSTNKNEIAIGESFTFTASYGGDCWGTSFTVSGEDLGLSQCSMNNTITPTSTGSLDYTFSITNGSKGTASCNFTVNVNQKQPTFDCPGGMTKGVGESFAVTPTNVNYCSEGCSYSVTGGTNGGASGSDYTGGALNAILGESSVGTMTYYLTMNNSAGDDSQNCSFDVEYVMESCQCSDYCSDCSNVITGSGTYNSNDYRCIFFTSASSLNLSGSATKINGVQITNPQCYSVSACDTWLSDNGVVKKNGGYFMDLPAYNYASITITGTLPSACAGGASSSEESSSSAESSSSESGGTIITVPLNYGTTEYDFIPGTEYKVTCSGGGTNLICSGKGSGLYLYLDGTLKYTNQSWQTLGNYQSAGNDICNSEKTVTVTGGTIRCKNQW